MGWLLPQGQDNKALVRGVKFPKVKIIRLREPMPDTLWNQVRQ